MLLNVLLKGLPLPGGGYRGREVLPASLWMLARSGGLTGGRGLPENHRALVVPSFCISHLQRGFGGRLRSPRKSLNNAGVLDWSRYEFLAVQFNLQRWLYS